MTSKTTSARLVPGDRARIAWVLLRVNMHLDGRVSGRRRRAIRRELRANLVAAATDRGAKGAVAGLGDLRDLARSFVEAEVSGVRWWSGTVAAEVMLAVLIVATQLFGLGFVAGARAADASVAVAYAYEIWDGFGPLRGAFDPATRSAEVQLFTPSHFVAIVAAYAFAARIWRWRPGA